MREVLDQEPKKKKKKRDRKIRVDVRNISGGDALHMICFRHLRPCISSGLRIHHEMGQREREGLSVIKNNYIFPRSESLLLYSSLYTRTAVLQKKNVLFHNPMFLNIHFSQCTQPKHMYMSCQESRVHSLYIIFIIVYK